MRILKAFEEFLEEGTAKRVSVDKQRAQHLRQEAERKYTVLTKTIDAMGIDDTLANDYVEDCYNILMFLLRAHMLEQGYSSSGPGAHESEVAFARRLGWQETDVRILDELRYFRNGILYYGKQLDKEYAEKALAFTKKGVSALGNGLRTA